MDARYALKYTAQTGLALLGLWWPMLLMAHIWPSPLWVYPGLPFWIFWHLPGGDIWLGLLLLGAFWVVPAGWFFIIFFDATKHFRQVSQLSWWQAGLVYGVGRPLVAYGILLAAILGLSALIYGVVFFKYGLMWVVSLV